MVNERLVLVKLTVYFTSKVKEKNHNIKKKTFLLAE